MFCPKDLLKFSGKDHKHSDRRVQGSTCLSFTRTGVSSFLAFRP